MVPIVARVMKPPVERRGELLDHAERLFFAKGYDATSVSDIIAAAEVSKGAFYHHFASKEALLDALAERLVERGLEAARAQDAPGLGALERLNRFFAGSRRMKVEQAPGIRASIGVMFRPENLRLRHRITEATIARLAPELAAIIAQGVEEGVLDTPDPLGTAELLLQLGVVVHDAMARALNTTDAAERAEATALLERRLELYEVAFNRVLGLGDHALALVEPGFAEAVMG